MRCPACGHEERSGAVCAQCATPLPEADAPVSSPPPLEKPDTAPAAAPPKEAKHRPRPLHDLDLTLPELDIHPVDPSKPQAKKEPAAEAPSFTVTDKRRSETSAPQSSPSPKTQAPPESDSLSGSQAGHPANFSSFIFSMGATALMAMGEAHMPGMPSGQSPDRPVDLAQARELINLIGMLESKTKGNLTTEESELLQQTLYNLRMKYVQASKKKKGLI